MLPYLTWVPGAMFIFYLPAEAFERDNFYVQPVAPCDLAKSWFTAIPIGKNNLGKMVKEDGNIAGRKTNHSLLATGVSDLFQAGVPDKMIQERSGHLSKDGRRQYQRTTLEQEADVSKVLASGCSYVSVQQSQRFTSQPACPTIQNFSGCNVTNGPPPTTPPQPKPLDDITNTATEHTN